MTPILIPLFVALLFSFYLSLTSAVSIPRDIISPVACPGSQASFTQGTLNITGSSQYPAYLPASSRRSRITIDTCASAFGQLDRVSRTLWKESRYEWAGNGGQCTIVLKAEKVPPQEGERFLAEAVDEAAVRIIEGCGVGNRGRPVKGRGNGGSLGLEVTAEGLEADEWRVWVLGTGVVGVGEEEVDLIEGSDGAQTGCTS